MNESLVIAAILALCAGIVRLRPQSLSTLSETQKKSPETNLRAVRRIAAEGWRCWRRRSPAGAGCSCAPGAAEATITAVRIVVLFVGVVGIVAAVEIRKNRNA